MKKFKKCSILVLIFTLLTFFSIVINVQSVVAAINTNSDKEEYYNFDVDEYLDYQNIINQVLYLNNQQKVLGYYMLSSWDNDEKISENEKYEEIGNYLKVSEDAISSIKKNYTGKASLYIYNLITKYYLPQLRTMCNSISNFYQSDSKFISDYLLKDQNIIQINQQLSITNNLINNFKKNIDSKQVSIAISEINIGNSNEVNEGIKSLKDIISNIDNFNLLPDSRVLNYAKSIYKDYFNHLISKSNTNSDYEKIYNFTYNSSLKQIKASYSVAIITECKNEFDNFNNKFSSFYNINSYTQSQKNNIIDDMKKITLNYKKNILVKNKLFEALTDKSNLPDFEKYLGMLSKYYGFFTSDKDTNKLYVISNLKYLNDDLVQMFPNKNILNKEVENYSTLEKKETGTDEYKYVDNSPKNINYTMLIFLGSLFLLILIVTLIIIIRVKKKRKDKYYDDDYYDE